MAERPGGRSWARRATGAGGAAASPRANLLGLLTKSCLGVAVCVDTLKVWRPGISPELRAFPVGRNGRSARGRRRRRR